MSFNIEESSTLRNLSSDLDALIAKYGASVRCEEGLVIRPKATHAAERAFKLKHKYKRLSRQALYKLGYKSLQTNEKCPRGRPRQSACYRNRVGKKVGLKRKVGVLKSMSIVLNSSFHFRYITEMMKIKNKWNSMPMIFDFIIT